MEFATAHSVLDNRQGHELKGEEAQLKCSAEYADGVTSDVTLEEMHGTKDVSCAKVKTVMRNAIRESEGNDIPTDTAKVKLSVESATEGAAPLAGFTPKVLEFTVMLMSPPSRR